MPPTGVCFWFDGQAQAAAQYSVHRFGASVFADSAALQAVYDGG